MLVELKQAGASAVTESRVASQVDDIGVGDLELISLFDGFFRLDGGAMFGVVPKTLWEKKAPPDDRNRILMAMRPLSCAGRGRC